MRMRPGPSKENLKQPVCVEQLLSYRPPDLIGPNPDASHTATGSALKNPCFMGK
jgi:hypothetical protein